MKLRQYKKKLKRAWIWSRIRQIRFKRWWFRNDSRYGLRWRVGNGAAAVLMLAAAVLPVLQEITKTNAYLLDADTIKLVGVTDPTLAKQLTYDAPTQTYQFNQAAIKSDDGSSNPLAAMQAQVGTANGQDDNKSLYALDVPQDITKGVTYNDVNSGLSFSLVPQFSAQQGQEVEGHLVFPLGGGTQAIYTLKNNGLKEDIVVPKASSDTMTFSYKLDLPKTLVAKVIPNSDGAIGVYSADPTLFGNISYGSDEDRAQVEKARENGAKTYLVFGLPSPVIKAPDGTSVGAARFVLDGDQLSVVASGLSGLNTPVTIDPSVVVTSSSDFQVGGNEEGNIDFGTNQINRGGITGGSISVAWSTEDTLNTGRGYTGTTTYNGYAYVLGGTSDAITPLNTGEYTHLGTDGSTNGWGATSTFSTARSAEGAVAYDGFMYVLGGSTGNCDSSTACTNSVEYAPISSNGSLGTWHTTTSFTGAREGLGAVAYNGYLYIAGGDSNGTHFNDVQYAPINADGTVGSWQYTYASGSHASQPTPGNSAYGFTTARGDQGFVVYNGYLYVIGGETGAAVLGDVQYAPINADGTVGTWATNSNSLMNIRAESGVTVYNGYIYLIDGYDGGLNFDTEYAPINANGSVGVWQSGNDLPGSSLEGVSAFAYAGYVFAVGGSDGFDTPFENTTYSIQIDSPSVTTSYATTTALKKAATNTSVIGGMTVAYANRLYTIGGVTAAAAVKTIAVATISTSGTIGAWSDNTTQLTANTAWTGATIYNGFIYVVGGTSDNDTTAIVTVEYAPINASTGVIGTWTNTTGLSAAAANHKPVAYNGYLYYRGSGTGAANNLVSALICTGSNNGVAGCGSTAGTVGTWASALANGNLNTSRLYDSMIAYGGYMYVVGGSTSGLTAPLSSIEYALICTGSNNGVAGCGSTAGKVGTWTVATNTLNTARLWQGTFIANGYMYVVGGTTGSGTGNDLNSVENAAMNTDGTVGAFDNNVTMPKTVGQGSFATYDGYIYSISGRVNGTAANTVYTATINNGGSGTHASWTTNGTDISGAYSSGWGYGGLFASGGYLYTVGGYNGSTILGATYSAPLNTNGSVGSWTSKTTLTDARYKFGTVLYNGYVYVCGGIDSGGDVNTCEYAQVQSSGGLSSWAQTTMNLGVGGSIGARNAVSVGAYNGYLYLLGGTHSSTPNTDVYYASLSTTDGSIGSWTATTSFGAPARSAQGSFIYDGYLYVLGGLDSSSNNLSDVQFAALNNSTGAVGAWQNAGQTLVQPRSYMQVSAADGYVYVYGGVNSGSLTDLEFAPIGAKGSLGTWQESTGSAYTTSRKGPGGIIYNGILYMVGGDNGTTFQKDVLYTPLSVQPRIGHYSKLVDLGVVSNVTSITYNGTIPSSLSAITYRGAGNGSPPTFGSTAMASSVSGNGGCVGNLPNTRYVWVFVTLDDSYGLGNGGIFPDVAGVTTSSGVVNASLTDFTINYSTIHPAPNIRLRGGQSLQAGNLAPLDTCTP